jgi:hypothetical protein
MSHYCRYTFVHCAGHCCETVFVGCFSAHQHLGHIGPTLGDDKEYIRWGLAISRLLRQAGLGRDGNLSTRCLTGGGTLRLEDH